MGASFFTSDTDAFLMVGSNNFAALISNDPEKYGLTADDVSAFNVVNDAWQAALRLAEPTGTRTKALVCAKNEARAAMCKMAALLTQRINGHPGLTDQDRTELGISVRKKPSPLGPPGTPTAFNAKLQTPGSLELTWKCDNPRGSTGTIYRISRRLTEDGPWVNIGQSGVKRFIDTTLPPGTVGLMYEIQATRSTCAGSPARFAVNFGVSGAFPISRIGGDPRMQQAA